MDRGRAIASLPQRAGTFVPPIEIVYITTPDALHHAADARRAIGRHQEMDMVRHEHVRMDHTTMPITGREKISPEARVVGGVGEKRRPVVAALRDMLGLAR